MSTIRANAILDSAGGNTATINGIPLRPGVLDPENRIINGAMDFWQRGTTHSANGYGSADRWRQSIAGGTVSMSRQSFSLGDTLGSNSPTYFLRQSVSGQTLTTHYAQVTQCIEGVRSYAGQTITVLGWARRSSGLGNLAVSLTQYFGTGGAPSASVDLAGQTITLTTSWVPFAVTFAIPSVAGKTVGSAGDDSLWLSFWTSAGSDFNARSNSLGLQTIGVDLWGIHIKLGTHTTAATDLYKAPELGPELARCQRYYEAGDYYFNLPLSNASVVASYNSWMDFATTKRVQPSVTGTNAQGTFSASNVRVNGVGLGRSDVVANRFNSGTYAADAEL